MFGKLFPVGLCQEFGTENSISILCYSMKYTREIKTTKKENNHLNTFLLLIKAFNLPCICLLHPRAKTRTVVLSQSGDFFVSLFLYVNSILLAFYDAKLPIQVFLT